MKAGNEHKEDRPCEIREATDMDKGRRKPKGPHNGTSRSTSGSKNVVFAPFLPFCSCTAPSPVVVNTPESPSGHGS